MSGNVFRCEAMDEQGVARCVEVSKPLDGYVTVTLATIHELGEEERVTNVSMPTPMAMMLATCLFAAMHGSTPEAQP